MKKILLLTSVAMLAASGVAAEAATAVYTISGTGSGVLNGNNFNAAAFTLTLTGSTDKLGFNIYNPNFPFARFAILDPVTTATATIAGFGSVDLQIQTKLGINNQTSVFFARSGVNQSDLFDFNIASPVNLGADFGPVLGTGVFALQQFQNVATTGGLLSFSSSSDV